LNLVPDPAVAFLIDANLHINPPYLVGELPILVNVSEAKNGHLIALFWKAAIKRQSNRLYRNCSTKSHHANVILSSSSTKTRMRCPGFGINPFKGEIVSGTDPNNSFNRNNIWIVKAMGCGLKTIVRLL
jgi:hypothetical protein